MHASEIKVQADGMPAKGAGIRGETAQINNQLQLIEVNGNCYGDGSIGGMDKEYGS